MQFVSALVGPQRDGRVVYAGASASPGIYVSRDGGATWPDVGNIPPVLSLSADPFITTTIYAGAFGGGLYRSTNEGASWATTVSPPDATIWAQLMLTTTSPHRLIVGTNSGIYYSASPFNTWSAGAGPIAGRIVYALAMNPANGDVYAATSGNGVFRSTDSGVSWSATALGGVTALALAIDSSGRIYAGVSGQGVFLSTNNGSGWAPTNVGMGALTVNALAIDPSNPARLFAATTGGGVFSSSNGAASWAAYNSGLSQVNVNALALSPTCFYPLVAGTDSGVWVSDTH